jgi:hypothetical protein
MRRLVALVTVALILGSVPRPRPAAQGSPSAGPAAAVVGMPNAANSLKFAVLGDFGTGSKNQYDLAAVMAKTHQSFPFELVILVGDNLYGSERPQDFQKKFETPYKPLLDAGV